MKSSHECLNRTSAGETRGGDHSSTSGNGSGVFEDGCSSAYCSGKTRGRYSPNLLTISVHMVSCLKYVSSSRAFTCFPFHNFSGIDGVDGDAAVSSIFTGTILPRTQSTHIGFRGILGAPCLMMTSIPCHLPPLSHIRTTPSISSTFPAKLQWLTYRVHTLPILLPYLFISNRPNSPQLEHA